MLWNDSAKIVDPIDYQLYDWSDWSRMVPDRDEPFIQSVRQRIRIPALIALTKFDAMPTQKHCVPADASQSRIIAINSGYLQVASAFF